MAGEKIDLYKIHKCEYAASKKRARILTIGPAKYLTVVGLGEPGGEAFTAKLGALYTAAYTIKMTSKFAGRDYVVCKLEGLWWGSRTTTGDFSGEPRDQWNWKLIIRTPDFIGQKDLEKAIADSLEKGKDREVANVRLETIEEGLSVQMLHVGPYADERSTIHSMMAFAEEQGYRFDGLHHEIYLSDPRRTAPEKIRTIIRMPLSKR